MSTSFRFTVGEYERMHSSGVFEEHGDVRVELLYGEIVGVNPRNPPHAFIVDKLNYWSIQSTADCDIWIRIQNPIGIPEIDSLPEPDVAWLKKRDYGTTQPQPEDVLLLQHFTLTCGREERFSDCDAWFPRAQTVHIFS